MSLPARAQSTTNTTAEQGNPVAPGDSDVSAEHLHEQVDALHAQIASLIERQGALEAVIAQMAALLPTSGVTTTPTSDDSPGRDDATHEPPQAAFAPAGPTGSTSRRDLLKWGGLGAAAALAVAGGSALTSQTAHAADGGNMVLGHINAAESATVLNFDGSSTGVTSLVVNGPTDASSGGISASAGLTGVSGQSSAASGTGVAGGATGTNGVGVSGFSTSGYGVAGSSAGSSDLAAVGTGRIFLKLTGDQPGPPKGPSVAGQIAFVPDGFFLCTQSGNPGTWLLINAGQEFSTGAINFLPSPIRLLDTRTGFGTSGPGPWTAGSTHVVGVVGVNVGGISIPGGVGVVGNVTVVTPSAGGDLRVYPLGPAPNTSSINFASGQIIANAVTVGFAFGTGAINIKVDMPTNTHTHVLFDATAYYA